MNSSEPTIADEFFEDPDSTREEILGAAFRALCKHGYSELTLAKIGEEFDKSTSLVYHHFEGKDDLLIACLEFVLDSYEQSFLETELTDPRARLEEGFDEYLTSELSPERSAFARALVELRGQAPHDERYREHFTRSDRLFEEQIATIIEAGIESGEFEEVDPEQTAGMLQTLFAGALFRQTTVEDDAWIDDVRREVDIYLQTRLYTDN